VCHESKYVLLVTTRMKWYRKATIGEALQIS
jgi:hypothetical protein